jgi:nucleotide-binding universal stress UspA family protein
LIEPIDIFVIQANISMIVAQQWNADLIILGRHDQSAITEFFTGSVSNPVVDRANCSVLVIKNDINRLAN